MLKRVGKYFAEALELAAQADERADNARDPITKADNQRRASQWRRLAESFAFVERLEQFLASRRQPRYSSASAGEEIVLKQRGSAPMRISEPPVIATYRVWQSGDVWLWEVNSTEGHNFSFGRTETSAAARAAAIRFWLDQN